MVNKTDPERIWLEPWVGDPTTYGEFGRTWCVDNAWEDEGDDAGVEYVRADLVEESPYRVVVEKLLADLRDEGIRLRKERNRMHWTLAAARDQFAFYEAQHLAKGTPESTEKARVNRQFADMCQTVIVGDETTLGLRKKKDA